MTKKISKLQAYDKPIYVSLAVLIAIGLLLGYIPVLHPYVSWISPGVALFVGLAYALIFGQPYPKFNHIMSKKLLQYSVVGLGFGMNLHASLASGKDGMMFTVVSVIGTMLLGWVIGRKVCRDIQ